MLRYFLGLLSICIIFILFISLIKQFIQLISSGQQKNRTLPQLTIIQYIDTLNQINRELFNADSEFKNFTSYQRGYFSNNSLQLWKNKYHKLYAIIKNIPIQKLDLNHHQRTIIEAFIKHMEAGDELREYFNQNFIKKELLNYQNFFNVIEGHSLDNQQRKAIIVDDDNTLVIAGAGSGKTTTIAGKVSYLIDRYKISPNEILLISFTRKACGEMKNRIKQKMNIDIDVMTFHKLGKGIIAYVEGVQPSVFEENNLHKLLEQILEKLLEQSDYVQLFIQYFIEHIKPYRSMNDFSSKDEYFEYLNKYQIQPFSSLSSFEKKNKISNRNEVLQSAEEVAIANFLLLNSIEYKHEDPYKYQTATKDYRQYKPDFYLPDYDIYIEHFGITDKMGNVPHWFADYNEDYGQAKKRYNDGIKWKREIHQNKGTTLIETYSYEMKEGILFKNLQEKLVQHGVILKPKSPEELLKIINASQNKNNSIIQLLKIFLVLFKSNNYSFNDLFVNNQNFKNEWQQRKNTAFIELFKPLYQEYNAELQLRQEIDFSDMINKAASYVNKHLYHKKYKYIIVDEFQDISKSRAQLIQSIQKTNLGCKLFCVGDDWQSIFRFAGSDISLFTQFEEYFGYTKKLYIETTYRFGDDLIDLSQEFILKNPNQVSKNLKSYDLNRKTPHEIIYYKKNFSTRNDKVVFISDTKALRNALDKIAFKSKNEGNVSVLILGRYNFDINPIQKDKQFFKVRYNHDKGFSQIIYSEHHNLKIEFLTVHKSKGTQADYVIIINCESGTYGFPSLIADDPILNLVLTCADQYENGEERRLFYVAMTRAKKGLYFLVNKNNRSKFISELDDENTENNVSSKRQCPRCKIGELVKRSGPYGDFYGCSNYPACRYTENIERDEYSEIHGIDGLERIINSI